MRLRNIEFDKIWQGWRDFLSYIHATDRKRRCRGSNRSRRISIPGFLPYPLRGHAPHVLIYSRKIVEPKAFSPLYLQYLIYFLTKDQLWFSACLWQGWRDSNPQPSVLETAVLPIGTTPLKLIAIIGYEMPTQQRKF